MKKKKYSDPSDLTGFEMTGYGRNSQTAQSKGDTQRRQSDLIDGFCLEHDFTLSAFIHDNGKSGYTGANITGNAEFAQYLRKARSRDDLETPIVLIVENLDRICRLDPHSASCLFNDMMEINIIIVDLVDDHIYYKGQPTEAINKANNVFDRAHKESLLKSKRVSSKRASRRAEMNPKKWKNCPFWLTLSEDGQSYIRDEKAIDFIRVVFGRAAGGAGSLVIAKKLNADGFTTTKGKAWTTGSVTKLLKNRALIGEYQHTLRTIENGKRKDVPTGEPVLDYYPVVLDRALFDRVQAGMINRNKNKAAVRKRPSYVNITRGLCYCVSCKESLILKSQPDCTYLQCPNVAKGTCKDSSRPINYPVFEGWLRDEWTKADYVVAVAADVPEAGLLAEAQAEYDTLCIQFQTVSDTWENMNFDKDFKPRVIRVQRAKEQAEARVLRLQTELANYDSVAASTEYRRALVAKALVRNDEPETLLARDELIALLNQLKGLVMHKDDRSVFNFEIITPQGNNIVYTSVPRPYDKRSKQVDNIWSANQ